MSQGDLKETKYMSGTGGGRDRGVGGFQVGMGVGWFDGGRGVVLF